MIIRSFILFALALPVFAQSGGGNGDMPADKAFRLGQITAPFWIEKIALESDVFNGDTTSFKRFPVLKSIFSSTVMLKMLAEDIRTSRHIYDTKIYPPGSRGATFWAFTNNKDEIANPGENPLDIIRIFIPVVQPYLEGDAENRAAGILIHESTHHLIRKIRDNPDLAQKFKIEFLGSTDEARYEQEEQFCEDSKTAILKAWEYLQQMEMPDKFEIERNGAPEARAYHSAAWTGETGDTRTANRMVIWGGCSLGDNAVVDCGKFFGDGALYDVRNQSWETIPGQTGDSPSPRAYHQSAWIDISEKGLVKNSLIVWGGCGDNSACSALRSDGAIYDVQTRSWKKIPNPSFTFSGRTKAVSVWTGKEFLIWGGEGIDANKARMTLNDGAAYNPDTKTWRKLSASPLPATLHAQAVWTGKVMAIYGGCAMQSLQQFCSNLSNKLGLYDPASDKWDLVDSSSMSNGRDGRFMHTMTYIPQMNQLWIVGGQDAHQFLGEGLVFQLSTRKWTNIPDSGFPRGRHTSVWNGRELLVFGGVHTNLSTFNDDLVSLSASSSQRLSWQNLLSHDGTLAVMGNSSLWTGSFMLKFGGQTGDVSFTDQGFIYKPKGFVAPILEH